MQPQREVLHMHHEDQCQNHDTHRMHQTKPRAPLEANGGGHSHGPTIPTRQHPRLLIERSVGRPPLADIEDNPNFLTIYSDGLLTEENGRQRMGFGVAGYHLSLEVSVGSCHKPCTATVHRHPTLLRTDLFETMIECTATNHMIFSRCIYISFHGNLLPLA